MRFWKNRKVERTIRCRPDIVFPTARVAVFVDGCFWHRCAIHGNSPKTNSQYWTAKLDRNVERDRRNDAALATAGWLVVRVWEHETAAAAADRIVGVIALRS
jgi:DNA mismatch endonuclease (patch repair protein)